MGPADLPKLLAGAADVVPEDGLEQKLALGRPLRVKLGIDPSRPDLHLGHAVVLRKLRLFQELGHEVVLIIGDFTGRVGDPSGQSETRPFLTEEEIAANARSYLDQAGTVLDLNGVEVRHNSEWLAPLSMVEVLDLTSQVTVAQMLERDDFRQRFGSGRPISVVEFLYPLMQAMDSVAVRADVEMGGTDQTFNLLVGREIQQAHHQDPQVVFTMPLLEGTDGVRKMSKSYDNYVGLTEPAEEMFGKLMSIPDELIAKYLLLCTDAQPEEVTHVESGLANGSLRPNDQKRRVAMTIVDLYHGAGAGERAQDRFDLVHRAREIPPDAPEVEIPDSAIREGRVWLPRLLAETGLATSNAEARRLVKQGGVRLDGEAVIDPDAEFTPTDLAGRVLQVGRRRFLRLR